MKKIQLWVICMLAKSVMFSQADMRFFSFSKPNDHGVFLDRNGSVGGYFKIRNISGDTLTLSEMKWSWGGGCTFHSFGFHTLYPHETGIITFSANVLAGRYQGNFEEMMADTNSSIATKSTQLSISFWNRKLGIDRVYSSIVDFWPLHLAGSEDMPSINLKPSQFGTSDLEASIVVTTIPFLRRSNSREGFDPKLSVTGLIEIKNESPNCFFLLRKIRFQSGSEVLPMAPLTLLHPDKSFVYLIRWNLTFAEFKQLSEKLGIQHVAVSLLFENAENEQFVIQRTLEFDFAKVRLQD